MSPEITLHEATFRAFGSNCRIVCDIEGSVARAIHRLEDLEARWSRFRPNSEISMLNASGGKPMDVSSITADLVERAMYAHERTEGRMNPLMLRQLHELGYQNSHEQLDHTDAPCTQNSMGEPATTEPILVNGATIRLPANASFDPGGIGKGLAADLVAEDLLADGAAWVMVSLGGDIRLAGEHLAGEGVEVQVDDPRAVNSQPWGTVVVTQGALATSSTAIRRWTKDGAVHHHLLNPLTGLPARSDRIAATAFAEEAWWADVVAKVLIIDPSLSSLELTAWGVEAVVFTADGVEQLGANAAKFAA